MIEVVLEPKKIKMEQIVDDPFAEEHEEEEARWRKENGIADPTEEETKQSDARREKHRHFVNHENQLRIAVDTASEKSNIDELAALLDETNRVIDLKTGTSAEFSEMDACGAQSVGSSTVYAKLKDGSLIRLPIIRFWEDSNLSFASNAAAFAKKLHDLSRSRAVRLEGSDRLVRIHFDEEESKEDHDIIVDSVIVADRNDERKALRVEFTSTRSSSVEYDFGENDEYFTSNTQLDRDW